MEQELQSALVEFIGMTTSAAEFGAAQMPEVVEQLLTFSLINAIAFLVFALISFAVFVYFAIDAFTAEVPAAGAVASLAFAFFHASEMLKITIAPKVWLTEYAAGLVK